MSAIDLLFKIKADSSQAKSDITQLRGLVSKEIGGIGNDFASAVPGVGRFAGALGPVGVGLVATAGAAIGAGVAIFGLAKHAADAGSEINDLSIKTGLSAETLSGLKLQATQSGTSLDTLATGVFTLQKNMAAAADGSKELSQTFKDLGVDVKGTTDDALRQLFKSLAAIPDEGRRNAEGAKVMGRAYKELAVLFKDVDGDMDAVIKRARELGLVISGEAAAAADKFGDDLDALNAQLDGVARQIGQVLIPAVSDAVSSISASLAANASTWAVWAQAAVESIRNVVDGWRMYQAIMSGNAVTGYNVAMEVVGERIDRARIAKLMSDPDLAQERGRMAAVTAGKKTLPGPDFGARGGGGGKKGGGGGKAAVVDSNQLEITRRETERFYKDQEEIVQRSYEKQLKTIEEFTDEQIGVEQRRAAAMIALLIEERSKITETGEARLNKEREINEQIAALRQESQSKIQKIRDDGAEEAEKIEEARREKFEAARSAADDLRVARIQNAIKERQVLESEGEREITDIRAGAVDRRVELLEMELSKFRDGSAEYLKIQGEISAAESERVAIIEDGVQRAIDARRREVEDMLANAEAQREARLRDERENPVSGRSLFGEDFANTIEGGASNFQAFGTTVTGVLGSLSAQAGNFKTIMTDAFGALASGVGATVKNFILLGNSGGQSFKKFVAEVIAGVATMAAVKAVFELAEGIASLFFNPAAAAQHFLAAKIYGSIAIIAGIAGRVLAGNSFAPGGGAAAGAGAGGGTGGTGTRATLGSEQQQRTIIQPRNQPQQVIVHLEVPHGFVAEKIKENIFLNGELVQLIVQTAAR